MKKSNSFLGYPLTVPLLCILIILGCSDDETLTDNNFEPGTVIDIDGNIYPTVIIGNQEWMVENLRVTRYNNKDNISTSLSNTQWATATSGAYAVYNNSENMLKAYGKLYNWYAVDDTRGLCPAGWSIPTNADWMQLVNYVISLGFPNDDNNPNGAGNALKSCRQVDSALGGDCDTYEHPRWNSDVTHYGLDEFGFSALPGGRRSSSSGSFGYVGLHGYWWSSSKGTGTNGGNDMWIKSTDSNIGHVDRDFNFWRKGFSIRCLRNID